MQHVFIVGSKGVPAAYGGYETFVDRLTERHEGNPNICYHVACKADGVGEFEYHGARCFKVKVPNIGPAQAIWYDMAALSDCVRYIRENAIEHPIVYVLACRIGPFAAHYQKVIHKLGGRLLVNPDGHEWMRAKWSAPIRWYWKVSEGMMARHCDLLVCDSQNIEAYIRSEYAAANPNTTFIAYGADVAPSVLSDDDAAWTDWLGGHDLVPDGYYLVVGRFVPENNYETMIREFMASSTARDFVLVTNVNDAFLDELEAKTSFRSDPRIKFVGTIYDQELLKKVRAGAHGYLHGHEVGGTNPSLLEGLAATRLSLLLDVGFNREVAEDAALYWTKEPGSLAALLEHADVLSEEELAALDAASTARIRGAYSWEHIASEYKQLFVGGIF